MCLEPNIFQIERHKPEHGVGILREEKLRQFFHGPLIYGVIISTLGTPKKNANIAVVSSWYDVSCAFKHYGCKLMMHEGKTLLLPETSSKQPDG